MDNSGLTETVPDGALDYELSIDANFERVIADEKPGEAWLQITDDD